MLVYKSDKASQKQKTMEQTKFTKESFGTLTQEQKDSYMSSLGKAASDLEVTTIGPAVHFENPDALVNSNISPRATIEGGTHIGRGVKVGGSAKVGEDVVLGWGSEVGPSAQVQNGARIGSEAAIGHSAIVSEGREVRPRGVVQKGD